MGIKYANILHGYTNQVFVNHTEIFANIDQVLLATIHLTINKIMAKSQGFTYRHTIILHSKKFKNRHLQCGSNDVIPDKEFQKSVVLLS